MSIAALITSVESTNVCKLGKRSVERRKRQHVQYGRMQTCRHNLDVLQNGSLAFGSAPLWQPKSQKYWMALQE